MMFGTQTNRGTRVALCDILDAFAKRDEKLINLSSIAKEVVQQNKIITRYIYSPWLQCTLN